MRSDLPESEYYNQFLWHLRREVHASPHTLSKVEVEVGRFLRFVGDPLTVTRAQAREYLTTLSHLKPSSLRVNWAYIRSFYRYLAAEGHKPADDITTIKIEVPGSDLPKVLSKETILSIRKVPNARTTAGARSKAVLELLISTGARASEIAQLQLANVDFEHNQIKVVGKGSKERILPLYGSAYDALKKWLELRSRYAVKRQAGQGFVFVSCHGDPMTYKVLYRIVKNAGLGEKGHIHPHAFRHTIATDLLRGGANIRVIQELLGHASLNTTMLYTKVESSEMKEQYLKALSTEDNNGSRKDKQGFNRRR